MYLHNSRKKLLLFRLTLETFRFVDEDDNVVEIWLDLKLFRVSKKKHNKKLRFILSPEKLTGLFLLKEVKPTRDRKMNNTSNIW